MNATLTTPSASPSITPALRALVERHLHLVENVARRLAKRPSSQLFDDLRSYGNEALVLAALRYDPSHNVPFQAFAIAQIRWAMLTGLRGERVVRRYLTSVADTASPSPGWVPSGARANLQGLSDSAFGEDEVVSREDELVRRELVRSHLAGLKNAEREVLVRRYYEGAELKDLVAPKRSYATVRRRHQAALAKLETRIRSAGSRSPTLH